MNVFVLNLKVVAPLVNSFKTGAYKLDLYNGELDRLINVLLVYNNTKMKEMFSCYNIDIKSNTSYQN